MNAKTSNETKRPRTSLMEASLFFACVFARAFSLHRLCSTPDYRQERRAVPGRHRVHAAVRPVVHVPGGHRTGFVSVGTLDDEDKIVTHVTVAWRRGAWLHARTARAAIERIVLIVTDLALM